MIFIKYKNGRTLQGILLALGDRAIRVAIKDADDSALFRFINGVWVSEDCEIVTFKFAEEGFDPQAEGELPEAVFTRSQSTAVQHVM